MPGRHCPEMQVFRGYWMINWFLREFAAQELAEARALGVPPETLLDRFLRDVPAGSMGLMTLPHWGAQLKDPAAKGSMIGLGEVHTRGYFYRSLIEGLAFGLRDGLERIERAGRFRTDRIGIAGGASQSAEICQITADIFGRPLWAGETFEAAGLGAAALTAAGAGLHGSVAEAVGRMVRPGRIFAPRAANAGLYRDLYHKVHRRIQRRLGPLNAQIRQILDYPAALAARRTHETTAFDPPWMEGPPPPGTWRALFQWGARSPGIPGPGLYRLLKEVFAMTDDDFRRPARTGLDPAAAPGPGALPAGARAELEAMLGPENVRTDDFARHLGGPRQGHARPAPVAPGPLRGPAGRRAAPPGPARPGADHGLLPAQGDPRGAPGRGHLGHRRHPEPARRCHPRSAHPHGPGDPLQRGQPDHHGAARHGRAPAGGAS